MIFKIETSIDGCGSGLAIATILEKKEKEGAIIKTIQKIYVSRKMVKPFFLLFLHAECNLHVKFFVL